MKTRFPTAMYLALAATLVCSPARAPATEAPPEDLVDALRQGGLVLFIRHAETQSDYADQISAVMGDCSTQRTLSEFGWQQARQIGEAIRALEIPVGEVISSEYCRAWQTAELAFGEHVKDPALNFEPAEDYTEDQMAAMRTRFAPLLGEEVQEANRVFVGHDDPFEAATGIYPDPQGVAYVLRPDGAGGATVLGRIGPDEWPVD